MISPRLKIIFGLSIPLFIAHGIEEYITGFYDQDSLFLSVFHMFFSMSVHQASFLLFQIMLWLSLSIAYMLLGSTRGQLYFLMLVGLIYIGEAHHIIKAISAGGYYPGIITALGFPIFAFFFWKELIRQFQRI